MSRKLIFALALAVVLVSGAFAGAQAECNFCFPHISLPSCWTGFCAPAAADRDFDRPDLTCQGAYHYGPTVPEYMGSTGAGGG